MANALYASFKQALLTGDAPLDSTTVNVCLVDTAIVAFSAAHDNYDDISAGVVGTPQTLANKTYTGGVFDADDVTFTAVAGGSTLEAIVIYIDSGVPGTSKLVAWIDTSVTGLPVTTNGGNISITWDTGTNKIFAL